MKVRGTTVLQSSSLSDSTNDLWLIAGLNRVHLTVSSILSLISLPDLGAHNLPPELSFAAAHKWV